MGNTSDPFREPVQLDRTNSAFHDLYRLARLFLAGDWQSTTSGRTTGFSLLFPMNELFEMFIGKCLKRALAPQPVQLQDTSCHALLTEGDDPLFSLRPDVVIGRSRRRVILDTKWKHLDLRKPVHGVLRGPMCTKCSPTLKRIMPNGLILLYPWHRKIGQQRDPRPLAGERDLLSPGCRDDRRQQSRCGRPSTTVYGPERRLVIREK